MNMGQKYKNLIVALLMMLVMPVAAEAANLTLSAENREFNAGDEFLVELRLDSAGEKINVVDGMVNFDASKLEVRDISTGGSVFNLWTRTPVYSNDSGKIFFTGGTTQNSGNGKILSIVFLAKSSGDAEINISPDSSAYLADGKGTKETLTTASKQITINAGLKQPAASDAWTKILASDKTPPENLNVALGRDSSMFGGKYFLSFSSADQSSGVNYFQVQEGDLPAINSESPYVLKDQSLKSQVKIAAFDKAGNTSVIVVDPAKLKAKSFGLWQFIVIVLSLLLIGVTFIKYKKKKSSKA
ncbi:MAG: hypothetical protein HY918_05790 [Candidatus Doudnabacteria bacterium]|nr:hypothetical protein [Candidatus Doudnabacteria bacterium]